jgi:excisionase family DNA binding protein
VSKAKVYQMLATGELPVVRVGRAVRVPVAALHALVAEQVGEGRVDAA